MNQIESFLKTDDRLNVEFTWSPEHNKFNCFVNRFFPPNQSGHGDGSTMIDAFNNGLKDYNKHEINVN